jgi:hypothetical protein
LWSAIGECFACLPPSSGESAGRPRRQRVPRREVPEKRLPQAIFIVATSFLERGDVLAWKRCG